MYGLTEICETCILDAILSKFLVDANPEWLLYGLSMYRSHVLHLEILAFSSSCPKDN